MRRETRLHKAIERIAAGGWCQGKYFPGYTDEPYEEVPATGPVCVLGALAYAWDIPPEKRGAENVWKDDVEAVAAVIGHNNQYGTNVVFWNDHEGRTKDEVLSVLNQALQLRLVAGAKPA